MFYLALHWLTVPLDPVHSHRKSVDQIEALAVFGEDGVKSPLKAILEHTNTLMPAVRPRRSDLSCELRAASFHLGLKIENTKHLHAVI